VTRDEARKLLSGYATGSLTELERQLLFDAALEDQELFDELVGEQEVKELIELPGAKRRLLLALGPERTKAVWWPWAAGIAIAATIALAVWLRPAPVEAPVEMALSTQVAPALPEPETAAAPAPIVTESEPAPSLEKDAELARAAAPPPPPPAQPTAAAEATAPVALAKARELADNVKQAAKDEALPLQETLEARARTNLPSLAIGQAQQAAAPKLAPQAFLAGQQEATNTLPDTLTYEVKDTGMLRVVPSRAGVLEVTTGGRTLFNNPVIAGRALEISIPLEAQQLRIDFATAAGAPAVGVIPSTQTSGSIMLPAGPNPRAVITIPAQK